MIYYMHVVPGKIKIRTTMIQDDLQSDSNLNKCLSTLPGVIHFKMIRTPSSLFIDYDPRKVSYKLILQNIAFATFYKNSHDSPSSEKMGIRTHLPSLVSSLSLTGQFTS